MQTNSERAGAAPEASGTHVGDLPASAYPDAVGVLARGMRDNPIHVAAYGPDAARRERCHARLMAAHLAHAPHNRPVGLWRHGALVACSGLVADGGCRPGLAASARMAPALLALRPRTAWRVQAWLAGWRAHDPDVPHVHVGPLAVERNLQGLGLGSALLGEVCRRLDAADALAHLETDRARNVPFYERAGFRVVAQATVLGVPCWFMQRPPGGGPA